MANSLIINLRLSETSSYPQVFRKELVRYLLGTPVIMNILSWSRWVPYKRRLLYLENVLKGLSCLNSWTCAGKSQKLQSVGPFETIVKHNFHSRQRQGLSFLKQTFNWTHWTFDTQFVSQSIEETSLSKAVLVLNVWYNIKEE